MSATQANLVEVRSLLSQMLGSASDMVRLAPALSERVRQLPPADADLLSRYAFERAGLYSYVANFFDLPEDAPQSQNIRIPDDCWIRGVDVCVLPALYFEELPDAATWLTATQLRANLSRRYGMGWRGLVDVDWRIPSQQGFIQDGYGDLLAPASQVAGDGEFSVPLDWRLQREDTIIVRCANRINRTVDAECATYLKRTLPWVAVVFRAEKT